MRWILIGGLALSLGACGDDDDGGGPTGDTRSVSSIDSEASCRVEIEGYYYIAAPLPYSGAWPVGEEISRGMIMAVDEINDAGGIQGRPLGLVICDTLSEPDNATAIMTALTDANEVSATTCCMRSAETIPSAEIGSSSGLVMLSPGATSTDITDLDDDGWVNRTVPPDSFQGRVAAALAADLGEKVFVATLDDPYGTSLADVFIAEYERLQAAGETMQVLYAESEDAYSPTLSAVVDDIEAFAPDAVFISGLARDSGLLLSEASERGYQTEWVVPDGARADNLLDGVSDSSYFELVRGTAPAPPSDDFVNRYNDVWGENPSVFVAAAYDAIYLLAISMEIADDPDNRMQVRDALINKTMVGNQVSALNDGWDALLMEIEANGEVDLMGTSGPVDIDANGDVVSEVEVWGVEGGEFVTREIRSPAQ